MGDARQQLLEERPPRRRVAGDDRPIRSQVALGDRERPDVGAVEQPCPQVGERAGLRVELPRQRPDRGQGRHEPIDQPLGRDPLLRGGCGSPGQLDPGLVDRGRPLLACRKEPERELDIAAHVVGPLADVLRHEQAQPIDVARDRVDELRPGGDPRGHASRTVEPLPQVRNPGSSSLPRSAIDPAAVRTEYGHRPELHEISSPAKGTTCTT